MWKVCWNKGRLCWKITKLFYFCHLKKLVRPETFAPCNVQTFIQRPFCTCPWNLPVSLMKLFLLESKCSSLWSILKSWIFGVYVLSEDGWMEFCLFFFMLPLQSEILYSVFHFCPFNPTVWNCILCQSCELKFPTLPHYINTWSMLTICIPLRNYLIYCLNKICIILEFDWPCSVVAKQWLPLFAVL